MPAPLHRGAPEAHLRRIDNETCSKTQDDGANLTSLFLPNGLQQRHDRVMCSYTLQMKTGASAIPGLVAVVRSEDHPCFQLRPQGFVVAKGTEQLVSDSRFKIQVISEFYV